MSPALVDLVVITYNQQALTARCLDSLRRYTPHPYHLIVVDNGSRDGTVSWLRGQHDVTLIANPCNVGYARACNQGIRAGSGEYIVLLNNDTEVTPGWLPPLLACLNRSAEVGIVGPKLVDGQGRLAGAGIVWDPNKPGWHLRGYLEPETPVRYTREIPCIAVTGACLALRRANLPRLGLMDEGYFFFCEDLDYCLQAQAAGLEVRYCPASRVVHYLHQAHPFQPPQALARWQAESLARFNQKWNGKELHLERFLDPDQTAAGEILQGK